jgi:exonuclease III
MRIATWNVNSLKARLEKVSQWLERARPDVLLMQETKLADSAAPVAEFRAAGYELVHHGEGQWNGVAIASRTGIADVVTNFGEPLLGAVSLESAWTVEGAERWWAMHRPLPPDARRVAEVLLSQEGGSCGSGHG